MKFQPEGNLSGLGKKANSRPRVSAFSYTEIISTISCLFVLSTIYAYHSRTVTTEVKTLKCKSNLFRLHQALLIYSHDSPNKEYPEAQKWCDSLVKSNAHGDDLSLFICPVARPSNDAEQCDYAINPKAKLNSSPDVVLLFEAEGGWNCVGGPELLNFENHQNKGCHILFNNGNVEFITPDQISELTWEDPRNSK